MLSAESATMMRATLPAVGGALDQITTRFYATMFAEHPELLDGMFNRGNQASGAQRQALAGSIAAFAGALLADPEARPDALLSRIAHKHVAAGVRDDQYTIVHKYLFGAIAEVLGDAVTPVVAAAWDEVYWLMAGALIAQEARLYLEAQVRPGHPWREWTVVGRRDETTDAAYTDRPLVLVSAGIGCTPMVAMLEHLAATGSNRPVTVLHADRSPARHVLRADTNRLVDELLGARALFWYEEDAESVPGSRPGLMDVVDVPADASVYLCGPLPFMRVVRGQLLKAGVPARNIGTRCSAPTSGWRTPPWPDVRPVPPCPPQSCGAEGDTGRNRHRTGPCARRVMPAVTGTSTSTASSSYAWRSIASARTDSSIEKC